MEFRSAAARTADQQFFAGASCKDTDTNLQRGNAEILLRGLLAKDPDKRLQGQKKCSRTPSSMECTGRSCQ